MKFIIHFFIFVILLSPSLLFATTTPAYSPLVGLPGFDDEILGAETNFNDYINALYAIAIAIAALLAVIKVIIAGVKWMLTDIVTSKEEAKKDIKGALLGLIIVLSAVLILTVINPNLVSVDLNKTVIGDEYVPPPPPPTLTFSERCTAAGGIITTCPAPHPTGEACMRSGFSNERACDPSIVNNCLIGSTCDCKRYPTIFADGTEGFTNDCSTAISFCTESGGVYEYTTSGTRINCGFSEGSVTRETGTSESSDGDYIIPSNVSIMDIGTLGEQYNQTLFSPANNQIVSFKITVPSTGVYSGDFRATKTSYSETTKLVSISKNPGDYKNPLSTGSCVKFSVESTRVYITSNSGKNNSWCILNPGETYYINAVALGSIESTIPTCTTGGHGGDCSFTATLGIQEP